MFKKILRTTIFLLTNSLESGSSKDCVKISVKKFENSSKIEASFRDSSFIHLLGQANPEIRENGFNISSDEKFETYYFYDSPIFNINKKNSEVKLICSKKDLNLEISSDFSIILSSVGEETVLESLNIISAGKAKNEGKISINGKFLIYIQENFYNKNGRIDCKYFNLNTECSLRNDCGIILSSFVHVVAQSVYNVSGSIYGSYKKGDFLNSAIRLSGFTKDFMNIDNLGGVFLNSSNVINQCGLICDLNEKYVNYSAKPDNVKTWVGLNNIHGKILGQDIFIKLKMCDLDYGLIESGANIKLFTDRFCSKDSYTIRAYQNILCQVKSHAHCNPNICAQQLVIKLKGIVTMFEFGNKTDINCGIMKILGESEYFHDIKLSGEIKSNFLSIEKCKVSGDVKFKVGSLYLTDLETKISLDNLDHDIKEIHIKTTETGFVEKAKLPKVFLHLSSKDAMLRSYKTVLNDLTILQDSDSEDGKLTIYGDITAKNLTVISPSSIFGQYLEIPLSVKANSLTIESGGLSFKGSNIETSDFHVNTREEFVQLHGGLKKVKNIYVKGAGLIVNQELSCEYLNAMSNVLWIANDVNIIKADLKTGHLVIADEKNNAINIILQEDSSIETVKGEIRNTKIDAQGALKIGVSEELNIISGVEEVKKTKKVKKVQKNNKIEEIDEVQEVKGLIVPSKIHSKGELTIEVGSSGHLKNIAGDLSSDTKIHQKIAEGGKVSHICAMEEKYNFDTKEIKDLGWKEYFRGDGGHHYKVTTKTPVPAKLKAPEIEFNGGEVKLEITQIDSDSVKGKVNTLNTSDALKIIEKDGQTTTGHWGVYSKTESHILNEEKAIKFIKNKIRNIVAENQNYAIKQDHTYAPKNIKKNFQLTVLSRSLINIACAFGISYMGGTAALFSSESTFAQHAIDGFAHSLVNKCVTCGASAIVGDKNYLDEILSQRALTDLVVGTIIQGSIGSIFGEKVLLQKGVSDLKNHFEFIKEMTLKEYFTKFYIHAGLSLAESTGDVLLLYAMGDEVTVWDFIWSFYRHEIATLSGALTTSIGLKYKDSTLTYFKHKLCHAVAAGGYQCLKLLPEWYNKDPHIWKKVVASALGGAAGAVTSEIVAEWYYDRYSEEYRSSKIDSVVLSNEYLSAHDRIRKRGALYGKCSTLAVGLFLCNAHSLNASYESGCRAINYNYEYSWSRALKNLKDGFIDGAKYFVTKNGIIMVVTCVNPAAGTLLANGVYGLELAMVGVTAVCTTYEGYKAYSSGDANKQDEFLENSTDGVFKMIGGAVGYVGASRVVSAAKSVINKAANQIATHILNEVSHKIRFSEEFSNMFRDKVFQLKSSDGTTIHIAFNDKTKIFECFFDHFNKNYPAVLNTIKYGLNTNVNNLVSIVGELSTLNGLNQIKPLNNLAPVLAIQAINTILNSGSTGGEISVVNGSNQINPSNSLAPVGSVPEPNTSVNPSSIGGISDLGNINPTAPSSILVPSDFAPGSIFRNITANLPSVLEASPLNNLNPAALAPIELILNKNMTPNVRPIIANAIDLSSFKSTVPTRYIRKNSIDKKGYERLNKIGIFKNYIVEIIFNETGDVIKFNNKKGEIHIERDVPLKLRKEMLYRNFDDIKEQLKNKGYEVLNNDLDNVDNHIKNDICTYYIIKDGKKFGKFKIRENVLSCKGHSSIKKLCSKLEIEIYDVQGKKVIDKITYVDNSNPDVMKDSKNAKAAGLKEDKKK